MAGLIVVLLSTAASPAPARAETTLVVEAKVKAITPLEMRCGNTWFANVVQYDVIRVRRGRYKEPRLYAAVSCGQPDGLRAAPRVGEKHRLWLTTDLPRAQLVDRFGEPHLRRYWVERAKLLAASSP